MPSNDDPSLATFVDLKGIYALRIHRPQKSLIGDRKEYRVNTASRESELRGLESPCRMAGRQDAEAPRRPVWILYMGAPLEFRLCARWVLEIKLIRRGS